MERYTFHQGLFRVNAHGAFDIQLDRLAVSVLMPVFEISPLTMHIDSHGA